MLKAIKADLHYDIPHDNKKSGQALAQILAEKANSVGDIAYFGVRSTSPSRSSWSGRSRSV